MLHFEHVESKGSGAPLLDFGAVFPLERRRKLVEVFNACSTPVNVWLESKPAWVTVTLPQGEEEIQLVVGESMLVRLEFFSDREMQEHDFEGALVFSSETQGQEKASSTLLLRARTSLDDAWGEYRFGDTGARLDHDFGEFGGKGVPPYRLTMRNMGRRRLEARLDAPPEWLQVADAEGARLAPPSLCVGPGEERAFLFSPALAEGVEGLVTANLQLTTNDVRDEFRRVSLEFRAVLPLPPSVSFTPPEPVLVGAGQKACSSVVLLNRGSAAVRVEAARDLPDSLAAAAVTVPAAGPDGDGRAELKVWISGSAERTGRQVDVLPLQIAGEKAVLAVPVAYECVSAEPDPEALDFGALKPGESRELSLRVVVKGRAGLQVQATALPALAEALTLSEHNGTVRAQLVTAKLPPQSFSAPGITLRFPELDATRTVGVRFEVAAPPPPRLWLLCPQCGVAAAMGAGRCVDPACAASLQGAQSVPENQLMTCPECHARYGGQDTFCQYDGTRLTPLKMES